MAEVIYSAAALADLTRIYDALDAEDPTLAANSSAMIRDAVRGLAERPLHGRPAEAGLRELAISRGRTGYVVLYRFIEIDDVVLIAAISHRHDAGYPNPR
jgi:addiction module RelE/StbE family toxin